MSETAAGSVLITVGNRAIGLANRDKVAVTYAGRALIPVDGGVSMGH